ncbi:hypothetical protein AAG906_028076 [Vitis piasezkii]
MPKRVISSDSIDRFYGTQLGADSFINEVCCEFFRSVSAKQGIKSLSITLKNISFNPLINAIEVYEMVDVPQKLPQLQVFSNQLGWILDGKMIHALLHHGIISAAKEVWNLENNKLQDTLPDSLKRESLEVRAGVDMRNRNAAARIFSYKEIKAATNNFKEVIGCDSFGSVYIGKLPDGKLVAVKVWFDRTQLGADSFINEFCHMNSLDIFLYLICSSKVMPE